MKMFLSILSASFFLFSCTAKKGDSKINVNDTTKVDTAASIRPDRAVNSYAPVDVSPMDMSYFPVDYPKLKMDNPVIASPQARVVYSRPHLQGRNLFHDVLKYGEPWRLGANEATELELYTDVSIQGKKIKSGRYIIYCIPEQDKWTIVLNSNIDSWGLHPDATKDLARFTVPATRTTAALEYFTIVFQPVAGGADLVMAWGEVEAKLLINF